MKKRLLERLLELAIPIPSRPNKPCWPQRIVLRRSGADNYGLADASQGFVQEFWLYPTANRLFYCDYLTQKWRTVCGFGCNLFFVYHSDLVLSGTNV